MRGHPYIVHMYHVCVAENTKFVAFEGELIELKKVCPSKVKIEEPLVQKIIYQMTIALESLSHYEKTVFIKPESILVKMDG